MSNKRLRSEIWEHFNKTPDGQRAICKYCDKSLSGNSKGGTSHLKRHFESCENHPKKDGNQPLALASRDEARNIGLAHHQIVELKKAILAGIPIASPDCKKYYYGLMGSMDVDKEICTYYEHEKEKLARELTSRVCFSFEYGYKYIFIVAHYVDEDFNLVRKLIGVKNKDDYDDDDDDLDLDLCIVEAIKSCIVDWKLGDKIFSIVGGWCDFRPTLNLPESHKDEFSSKMLLNGKFLTVPFCTNSVHDFYQKYIYPFYKIEKANIKKFYEDLKTSPNQMETFNNIARERGLPPIPSYSLCFWIDSYYVTVPFKDLENIFVYKDVFGRYEEIAGQLMAMHADQLDVTNSICLYPHAETDQPSLSKSSVDWKRVEGLVQYSHAASKIVYGLYLSNCPSSNLYFPTMVEIEDVALKNIYHDYCENWVGLLDENSHKLFEIANALDPRYKLTFSEYYWQRRSGFDIESKIDENKKLLEEVFSEYAKEDTREASSVCIESNNTQDRGSLNNSTRQCSSVIDEFSMFIKEKQKNKKSELDKYLDDELVDLNDTSFNLLGWWKKNRSRYPVLSRMARDVLAVPTCKYIMEGIISSDFSVPEEVSHELVEAVICMKEWILSEERSIQESDN